MRVPPLRRAALSLAVAACLLPLTAAPAAADSPPAASFVFITQYLDGSGHQSVHTLECDPDGGTHHAATFACDVLRSVDGDLAAVPPLYDPCYAEPQPMRAIAVGYWHGRRVHHGLIASDPCDLMSRGGGVFPVP
ncbi:MAG TPA: SSI family serine proteinase inhibitor [Thermobifida alba]|nr:SSI family serine proteinase inhibitor [Thermobifida alba]